MTNKSKSETAYADAVDRLEMWFALAYLFFWSGMANDFAAIFASPRIGGGAANSLAA